MNSPREYWQVGVAFDQAIDDIFNPSRLKAHINAGMRHYLHLGEEESMPSKITLPEAERHDKVMIFEFDLDKDAIHLLEVQYISERIKGSRIELLVGLGDIEREEAFGYRMDKFLIKLHYNAILTEMRKGPFNCEFYFSYQNLKEELKVW